jgi:hypothetical protein
MPIQGADTKPGLLAAVVEFLRHLFVEKHDCLADLSAVFRAAKAKHVDARLPGDFLGRDFERGHRVGKARAVHLDFEVVFARDGPDGL